MPNFHVKLTWEINDVESKEQAAEEFWNFIARAEHPTVEVSEIRADRSMDDPSIIEL